uniref:Uncharacterized protein n=1 Tax=Tanacetum cinerariifolium TaxID=118510 RepID=A0A6L2P6V1_TANCI|nr:hypothetical protein [Tanacetum cinerariifolium]
MESLSPQVVTAAKLPTLNPNEFDLWMMRIEQYFLMTNYSLWEVILYGDSPIPTRVVDGVIQPVAPTTAKQRLAKKNELKARGTLLMALPDKHQLKFNTHKDAKSLMEAIEKSTNESVSVVTSVSAASTKVPVSALPNVDNLSDADIDLKWQMVMLTMRAKRFLQRKGMNREANRTTSIGFDMSKCNGVGNYDWSFQADEEPTNYALMAFTSLSSSSSDNENENVFEEDIKLLKLDVMLRDNALVELKKKFEKAEQDRDELKLKLEKFQTFSKNLIPASPSSTTTTDTTSGESGMKSRRTVTLIAKDMQKKKNDVKARTTLLLSLPDEHQLRFSKYKTARELWAAILKTFGGNEATKKTKKNLLKQHYGNFKAEG